MNLKSLRTDLIERWKDAFGRIEEATKASRAAGTRMYSVYPAFALSNYTPKSFKPGARLSKTPDREVSGYAFRLDAQKRPLHVQHKAYDGTVWQGAYRYAADEVEHLEFCMETGVPSLYNRLILSDGQVVAEQRFVCNGGGAYPAWKKVPLAKRPARVLQDRSNYFLYLTLYRVEQGVVRSAEEYHEVSNGEIYKPTREYLYSSAGKLERIVQHWPDGDRTLFAAKSKTTLKELSEKLSERIAEKVVAKLRAKAFKSPLVALELTYREQTQHVPTLVPLTERDDVSSLTLVSEIDEKRWLNLAEEDFEPELADFNQRVESGGNDAAIAKMLREAARRVTELAPAQVPVAKGFVAFAIDWEMDGDDLAKILKQCGGDAEKIKEWRKKKWL